MTAHSRMLTLWYKHIRFTWPRDYDPNHSGSCSFPGCNDHRRSSVGVVRKVSDGRIIYLHIAFTQRSLTMYVLFSGGESPNQVKATALLRLPIPKVDRWERWCRNIMFICLLPVICHLSLSLFLTSGWSALLQHCLSFPQSGTVSVHSGHCSGGACPIRRGEHQYTHCCHLVKNIITWLLYWRFNRWTLIWRMIKSDQKTVVFRGFYFYNHTCNPVC